MQSERRKIIRRAVNYPARIDLGNGTDLIPCTLVDASDEGVQIVTVQPVEWPDQIELVLGYNGRRRCRIAWRNGRRAGLEFLRNGKRIPLVLPAEAPKSVQEAERAMAEPVRTPLSAAPPSPQPIRPQAPAEAFDIDTLPPAGPDPMQSQR
jgi:hypothetical protein